MSQNRNKLLQLLVGNLVNLVVHRVLEESAKEEILRNHYDKESVTSFEVAKKYREKINPIDRELPQRDLEQIKEQVFKRVNKELQMRMNKGYGGIDLDLVMNFLERELKNLEIEE